MGLPRVGYIRTAVSLVLGHSHFDSLLFSPSSCAALLRIVFLDLPSRPHSTRYLRPTNQRPSYLRTRTSFRESVTSLVHAHTRRPSFLSRWPLHFSPSKSIDLLHASLLRQPPNMFSTTAILRSLHKLWHCHRYIPFIIHLSDK
jgi:hypothetical protein